MPETIGARRTVTVYVDFTLPFVETPTMVAVAELPGRGSASVLLAATAPLIVTGFAPVAAEAVTVTGPLSAGTLTV
jgi:hypothetical protein